MIYRILMKILFDRLKYSMDDLISVNLCVFIHERNIRDGILYAHEIVGGFGKSKNINTH